MAFQPAILPGSGQDLLALSANPAWWRVHTACVGVQIGMYPIAWLERPRYWIHAKLAINYREQVTPVSISAASCPNGFKPLEPGSPGVPLLPTVHLTQKVSSDTRGGVS